MEKLNYLHEEDLGAVIRRYSDMVYRLAFTRTGNESDAWDVSQEVFLRLVKHREKIKDEEHLKAWLLRVTVNCSNSVFRQIWSKTEELDIKMEATTEDPLQKMAVMEAVMQLPVKFRTVIELFYYEDLTVAQIAKVTKQKEGTVKTQLSRARVMLRESLGEDF